MLIVSWNVAGLKPALQRIHSDYCSGSGGGCGGDIVSNDDNNSTTMTTTMTKRKSNNSTKSTSSSSDNDHPFTTFLQKHGSIDILCLQEHKIPHKSLSDRSEPHRCADIPGYESYWSCVSDISRYKGFNGVVTYAKSGTVRAANCTPLQNVECDSQGRCVMTDHGQFVLFNVYVPCGGGGGCCEKTLSRKMTFLHALRIAMDQQRRVHGKKVILVGDMNIKINKHDIYWEYLLVNVDTIVTNYRQQRLAQSQQKEGEASQQQQSYQKNDNSKDDLTIDEKEKEDNMKWASDVERHWQMIEQTLETTLVAIPRQTMNPSNGAKFDKFRARIEHLGGGGSSARGGAKAKFIMLGDNEDTAQEALSYYNFDEQSYIDKMTGTKVILRKKNLISIHTLSELMLKICNINWDESTRKHIAMSKYANLNLDSPPLRWMQELLLTKDDDDVDDNGGGGGMVDIFRHFYPTAEGRYTCWNQFTNKRYTNMGGRIDYTLVDKSLMEYVEQPPQDGRLLRCGGRDDNNVVSTLPLKNGERRKKLDPLSETAALMAATACGLFESGSFSGGGIASATKRALDTQFVGVPHSGMIYTPPSYSDHIAVSLLLKDDVMSHHTIDSSKLELMNDASTRKTQPHKRQRSISSFFSSGGTSTAASTSSSMTSTTVLQPDAGVKRQRISSSEDTTKAKGLYSFFGKSNTVKNKE